MPGSVVDIGNGKYRLSVSNGSDEFGKPIRRTKTITAKSKLEATKQLERFYAQVIKEGKLRPSKLSFADFAVQYDEKHLKRLSPTSRANELSDLRQLTDYFGKMPLKSITPFHVEQFFDELKERTVNRGGEIRPISDGTVFKFYRVLRAVFNRAVEWELLPFNPVLRISKYAKPKERHAKRKIYQSKDLECFLRALFALPEDFYNLRHKLMIYIMLLTGLRRGEVFALKYSDFDMETKVIDVNQSAYEIVGEKGFKDPKTESSIRTVPFDERVEEIFLKYKKAHEAWLAKHMMANPLGLVFTATKFVVGDKEVSPANMAALDRWLKRFTEINQLPKLTIHALRHTACSYALASGADLSATQSLLGHDNITTTAIYTHAIDTKKREAVDGLSKTYGNMLE